MITGEIKLVKEKILRVNDITIATDITQCPRCSQKAVWIGREYTFLFVACSHCHSIHEVVLAPKIP
jgi:hydrogenase maturation factor HypF (carbamoyltransferase family)